eukprot:TRINITY_DN38647_c0_g1_i1.p1 TRINITY_DN38647_c0_g1~~TRINITY_DN38647_c0_g1_i1.p1  ORF type:complete len:396 (-),score=78.26 TRINITY_DN38647_c0_g1_i1:182-1369(-)
MALTFTAAGCGLTSLQGEPQPRQPLLKLSHQDVTPLEGRRRMQAGGPTGSSAALLAAAIAGPGFWLRHAARRQHKALQRSSKAVRLAASQPDLTPAESPQAAAAEDASKDTSSFTSNTAVQRQVDGPTVVITGASQGVGRAASQRFAKAGYNVVLAARSAKTLKEAEDLCKRALKQGREALAVECDITDQTSVAALKEAACARFKDVRILVCNAGVCMTGDFQAHSVADFQAQLDVNFLGHVATVQAFMPTLKAQSAHGGRKPTVCFVNSFGARVPLPNMTAYCAAKYALQGFADSLRLEASPALHVATVHPGVIRSDFRERAQWRGSQGDSSKSTMDSLLDSSSPASSLVTQDVDEVAGAVLCAVEQQRSEVVVGAAFQTMLAGFGIAKAVGLA